jgi:hypothetical protein
MGVTRKITFPVKKSLNKIKASDHIKGRPKNCEKAVLTPRE